MYRVKTTYRNGTARPIIEHGPWHPARKDAEFWAEVLLNAGYAVEIESQHGKIEEGGGDNNDLAAALASMA
ncbi:MAG: hypothetical protein H6R14_2177 [Proteobacteria bacterium]|nr:hypothetical protein [Pseudomonadota bacterium]